MRSFLRRFFPRGKYDYQRILRKYSEALVRPTTDLTYLSKMFSYLLWKSMRLYGVCLIILNPDKKSFIIRSGEGVGESMIGQSLPDNSPLFNELLATRKEIDRDEIKRRLSTPNLSEDEKIKLTRILADLAFLKSVILIPCISESDFFKKPTLLSVICLGKKLSLEGYSEEDINFLKTIANQSAISIEYTFIYEELRKQQEQIIRSEKLAALGTLASGIAHELKNPLTYISTVSQAMGSRWDDKGFKESVLSVMPSEIERMRLILEGLSDYSRSKEIKLENTDIISIVEKVLAILNYEIKKPGITVKKDFPSSGQLIALGDKNRLSQVFLNIIANALQSMEKNGTLEISARHEENSAIISVSDNGKGIPEENLSKMFEPFFSTRESGIGLGLHLSKQIVEQHHGKISVKSVPGKTTTFIITLPM